LLLERWEEIMPTYVVLVNWTDKGIADVRDTEKRLAGGVKAAKTFGVTLKEAYWTMGTYDMVSIIDAPDDESLTGYLLKICSEGFIRTTTLRAFDKGNFDKVLAKLK
jgi:uncharacterized protein with GYD domain